LTGNLEPALGLENPPGICLNLRTFGKEFGLDPTRNFSSKSKDLLRIKDTDSNLMQIAGSWVYETEGRHFQVLNCQYPR